MFTLKAVSVLLVVFFFKQSVLSEHCDDANFAKCDKNDNDCIINELEPTLRKWMLKGQPGYFLEPLDPIAFLELPIETSKGVYKLQNVKVTGVPEAKFVINKFSFDPAAEGVMQLAFEFVFDLTADGFYDENGLSLLDHGPLIVHLDNLYVELRTEASSVERCGERYLKFNNTNTAARKVADSDVIIKSGMTNPGTELKQALAKTVGKACIKRIAESYSATAQFVPISVFWK